MVYDVPLPPSLFAIIGVRHFGIGDCIISWHGDQRLTTYLCGTSCPFEEKRFERNNIGKTAEQSREENEPLQFQEKQQHYRRTA